MPDVTIYHNPRCSKSRQTLALLEARGLSIDVVEYLKKPLNKTQLSSLLAQLDKTPSELIRKKDPLFKEMALKGQAEADLLQAMLNEPTLIERPIVVKGRRAVLGRPPENIEQLF